MFVCCYKVTVVYTQGFKGIRTFRKGEFDITGETTGHEGKKATAS